MRAHALAVRTPDPSPLPQAGWRLMGFASIGLGTGLFTADVPFLVVAAAFVPALIAMVIVAARTAYSATIAEPASRGADETARRSDRSG